MLKYTNIGSFWFDYCSDIRLFANIIPEAHDLVFNNKLRIFICGTL